MDCLNYSARDTLPLSGTRVIDFTHVIAGPFCTMMLAHMGADVVKVERPGAGDSLRNIPGYEGREGHPDYFNSVNNTKRSIALNLKDPIQQQAAVDLIREADVVVENFKPGTADRIGLGFKEMQKVNPKLIYCSICTGKQALTRNALHRSNNSGCFRCNECNWLTRRPAYDGWIPAYRYGGRYVWSFCSCNSLAASTKEWCR